MRNSELVDRWRAFGWHVFEVDGHDIGAFLEVIDSAQEADGPVAIIAHTVKGKGVSYMENAYEWHSKVPDDDQLAIALTELGETEAEGGTGQ